MRGNFISELVLVDAMGTFDCSPANELRLAVLEAEKKKTHV